MLLYEVIDGLLELGLATYVVQIYLVQFWQLGGYRREADRFLEMMGMHDKTISIDTALGTFFLVGIEA